MNFHTENMAPTAVPQLADAQSMFFCIGAQKAGTTWLGRYFGTHPECGFGPQKEMHYFDIVHGGSRGMISRQARYLINRAERIVKDPINNYERKMKTLRRYMNTLELYKEGAPPDEKYARLMGVGNKSKRYLCDFSPEYAFASQDTLKLMAGFGQRPAKFIFLMRDPVSRFWSQMRMRVTNRNVPEEKRLAAARKFVDKLVSKEPLAKNPYNNYARTLNTLESVVSSENQRIYFMDEIFSQDTLDEICDFLGIAHHPGDFSPVNEGAPLPMPEDLRAPLRESLDATYRFVNERYGDRVPESWRRHD